MKNDEMERKEFEAWMNLPESHKGTHTYEQMWHGWKARAALDAMRSVNQEMLEAENKKLEAEIRMYRSALNLQLTLMELNPDMAIRYRETIARHKQALTQGE